MYARKPRYPKAHFTSDIQIRILQLNCPYTASASSSQVEKNTLSRIQTVVTSQSHGSAILPIKQSLGLSGSILIIGGTIGLLGVYAFLTFLWFGYGTGSEAANATWAWRQIALRGYMEQVISVAALVLTFIVSLQATVCTSMIAALVLEKRSIPQAKVITLFKPCFPTNFSL